MLWTSGGPGDLVELAAGLFADRRFARGVMRSLHHADDAFWGIAQGGGLLEPESIAELKVRH